MTADDVRRALIRISHEIVEKHGVRIVGHANVPSRIAVDSSMLYAKNLFALLSLCFDAEKNFALPWDDEIVNAIALTRDGTVIHPAFAPESTPVQPASVGA